MDNTSQSKKYRTDTVPDFYHPLPGGRPNLFGALPFFLPVSKDDEPAKT